MDAQYATRKQQLLAACQVAPAIFHEVMPRLATCMRPFVRTFCRQEPAQHAHLRIPRIPATQSMGRLPLSPREACHPIHPIPATQST
jgi:hypothetical protein